MSMRTIGAAGMVPTAVRIGLSSGTKTARAVSERMVGLSVDIVISRHWPVINPVLGRTSQPSSGIRFGISRSDDMALGFGPIQPLCSDAFLQDDSLFPPP
jgi:hypothetical protein